MLKALNDDGRTVVCVHHDLSTVETYFDRVALLAGRVVAAGPTSSVFRADLLDETYGGRLPGGSRVRRDPMIEALVDASSSVRATTPRWSRSVRPCSEPMPAPSAPS